MKGIQCKAFLWLFVVSISQNVFFDSFANKRWIVHPVGRRRGFEALSHEKQSEIQCFAELFYLCRGLLLNVYF